MSRELGELRQLARLYGVQTGYFDVHAQRRREVPPETLRAVLAALGARPEELKNLLLGLRERQRALWEQRLEPVAVAWDGNLVLRLRLPARLEEERVHCHLELEGGHVQTHTAEPAEGVTLRARELEGTRYVARAFALPGRLPLGYHHLRIEIGKESWEALVISAPPQAYLPPELSAGAAKPWGVFLPLYALHSEGSWGVGDFRDLAELTSWVAERGGSVVATLPMLASFLDEPCEPSPYAPVSRLFWNELYLDVERIAELEACEPAKALIASAETQKELAALRATALVEHRRAMALKRRVLEVLARGFFARPSERRSEFERYVETHPLLQEYARFRAVAERRRPEASEWWKWPERLRRGELRTEDYNEDARRYHLYVQWQAQEQLGALSRKPGGDAPGLYLDLPLGTHRAGFDAWRWQEAFAFDFDAGAPPDAFFTRGQNWQFAPLHPEQVRARGYGYVMHYLRHHMKQADILRIDHVMGLHRLFWIPPGAKPIEGTYVRYAAEEFYALVCLESHRNRTLVVGEDLGTVPGYVRPAMQRHRLLGCYVLQFEVEPEPARALRPVRPDTLASMNTHDVPPFARWWQGLDIEDRIELGLLTPEEAQPVREKRRHVIAALVEFLRREGQLKQDAAEPASVLRACLAYLAASPARVVVANLEDLWLETKQQNTPGTITERPNWQRKAGYGLEEIRRRPEVVEALAEVNRQRRRRG